MLISKVIYKKRGLTRRVDSMCCCLTPKGDAYMHGLLITNSLSVQPFTATGPAEVKRLVDMITHLVVGATKDPTDKRKQIFSESMHIAIDNHFSGDDALRYLGEGCWKGTMTCRRNRLPISVPRKYFNFIKQHQSMPDPKWHNLNNQSSTCQASGQ
jgi:hypothetical protein